MQATLHLSVPGRFSHSLSVAMLLTLKRMAMMDPRIEWQEAEGHPYALSGKPWVGPDAVLNNLFMRLGTEWEGVVVHPASFHGAGDKVFVEGRFSQSRT